MEVNRTYQYTEPTIEEIIAEAINIANAEIISSRHTIHEFALAKHAKTIIHVLKSNGYRIVKSEKEESSIAKPELKII